MDESMLSQITIKQHEFKKDTEEDQLSSLLRKLCDPKKPHLMTKEYGRKGFLHYHFVSYVNPENTIKEQLLTLVKSHGLTFKIYNSENLNPPKGHPPEWYFGYIQKETGHEIIIGASDDIDYFETCLQYYTLKSKKTSNDMLLYIQAEYEGPYDPIKLCLLIQHYYGSNKKVYNKNIIIRNAFHLARYTLFYPEAEKDIRENIQNIING